MKAKDVRIGEFYNHTLPNSGGVFKVLVKSRKVTAAFCMFEVWEEDGQEPDFVPARQLSPLSTEDMLRDQLRQDIVRDNAAGFDTDRPLGLSALEKAR